jgi:hypothetical protein
MLTDLPAGDGSAALQQATGGSCAMSGIRASKASCRMIGCGWEPDELDAGNDG